MLKLTHKGQEIEVRFQHRKLDRLHWKFPDYTHETKAILFGTDITLPRTGLAICHKNDNFCRDTGRKIALTKAIKELDKDLRTAIWGEYFRMTGVTYKNSKKEMIEIIEDQLNEIMVELERKRIDRNMIADYTQQCQYEIKSLKSFLK